MTKIPWRGKETKASHKVFVATKPGECVSVDQMTSTEPGFYAQLKGKLSKKPYRCATIFVDYFSRLQYVHPQVDDSSIVTIAAKCAFESFAAEHGQLPIPFSIAGWNGWLTCRLPVADVTVLYAYIPLDWALHASPSQ
jgi:hypothetical protein